MKNACRHISTIILSAGLSSRMKQCKQVLPWGNTTILGSIIAIYQQIPVEEIIVVSGGFKQLIDKEAKKHGAISVFNPNYANGEMVDSVKRGIAHLPENTVGVFIAMGDQPSISITDVLQMVELSTTNPTNIIIPSYKMRRGHPWFIPASLFQRIIEINAPSTMRDFINSNRKNISYLNTDNSQILTDLDTPEDYYNLKPD
jgi:molybdenum cofactor cytidylyltransferase